MTCFTLNTRNKIAKSSSDLDLVAASIEASHAKLLNHRRDVIGIPLETEEAVTSATFFAFWQAQIHRGERLVITCGSAIENDDPYGLVAVIRAFVETTAIFISMYSKFDKWIMGKTPYPEFDLALTSAMFGQRHDASGQLPTATNVLTHIKNADSYIDQNALVAVKSPLATMYETLSEFAHPNFESNKQGVSLKRERREFRFHHNGALDGQRLAVLGTLATALVLFNSASDKIESLFSKTGTLFASG